MLSTSTYYLYTTRNVRQKHSSRPFWTYGNHFQASVIQSNYEQVENKWEGVVSPSDHIYLFPKTLYQSCDQLDMRHIESELVTYHQTHIQALSKTLCHSMTHRLWEVTQVFSHLYRHIFISLHRQLIATVVYITPTHMLCHPSMLTTPVSVYSNFWQSIPVFFPHDLFHHL